MHSVITRENVQYNGSISKGSMRTTLSEKLAQHFSRLIPFLMHASFFRGIKDWQLEMWTDFWLQAQLFWPFHGLDSTSTMLQKLLWNKTFSKLWLQGKDFKSWQHWHLKDFFFSMLDLWFSKKANFWKWATISWRMLQLSMRQNTQAWPYFAITLKKASRMDVKARQRPMAS